MEDNKQALIEFDETYCTYEYMRVADETRRETWKEHWQVQFESKNKMKLITINV